jgi:hypothetical protein
MTLDNCFSGAMTLGITTFNITTLSTMTQLNGIVCDIQLNSINCIECRNAECYYAECRYAECCGTVSQYFIPMQKLVIMIFE